MRVMVPIKANEDSDPGVMLGEQFLTELEAFNFEVHSHGPG